MRSTEEIRAEISETRNKLETLDQSVQKKQQELAKLKESHVQLVENRLGRERLPKSIGKQRESMLSQSLEIENLQIVQGNLESKLADLKTQLARSELFEHNVAAYQEAERDFGEAAEMALQEVVDLNRRMRACRDSVEGFLEQSGNSLEILRSLVNDPALSGLSLRDFFIGQVAEGGAEENAAFMQELVQVYRDIQRKLPMPANIQDSWTRLSDRLDAITRAAGQLVPRDVKYVSTEQKSAPTPAKRSKTVHLPSSAPVLDYRQQREAEAAERERVRPKVVNANRVIRSSNA